MSKMFREIIAEVCKENDIKYTFLSKDWVIMLEKGGNTKFISGYKFDLNPHGIGEIIDDKYGLYSVLNHYNIPVVEHNIVYSKTNQHDYAIGCNTYEYVKDYFIKNNNHIVIKSNTGTCGKDVYNVTSIDEIDNILEDMFSRNHSVSMCPFYNIKNEYRVVMLNEENMLTYSKNLPRVIGDGKKSIRELLFKFNLQYFQNKLDDEKYDRILKTNEEYIYNWKFNLSKGSIAKEVEDINLLNKLTKIATDVSNCINLEFGSVDIIETTNGDFLVLEVNSGVMIENYIKQNPDEYIRVKEIYNEAVKSLFIN